MKVWGTTDKLLRRYLLGFAELATEFIEIKDLENDLKGKKDPFIDLVLETLNESIAKYDYLRYRQITYRVGLYGLWGMFMDDAYNDFGRDIMINLAKHLQEHPELMKQKDPEKWYINEWWGRQK